MEGDIVRIGCVELRRIESFVYRGESPDFMFTVVRRGSAWVAYCFHGDNEIANATSSSPQFAADYLLEELGELRRALVSMHVACEAGRQEGKVPGEQSRQNDGGSK